MNALIPLAVQYGPCSISNDPKRGLVIVPSIDVLKKVVGDIPSGFEIAVADTSQISPPPDTPPLGYTNYLSAHVRGRRRVMLFSGGDTAWQEAVEAMLGEADAHMEKPPASVILTRGDVIQSRPIRWLWKDWLALGKLHILAGMVGVGKTTIALKLAATISHGGYWPDGSYVAPGNVLVWSGEDDPADTLKPRLEAMGADMTRIHFIGGVQDHLGFRPFDPARDASLLAHSIQSFRPALLIIDPLTSAVAGDSHKNSETRRALQPLVDLAVEIGVAILGISHFSKASADRDPVERVTGSIAFGALARVVMVAAKIRKEQGGAHLFCRAKSNLGLDDGGFLYGLEQVPVPSVAEMFASSIVWGQAATGAARELLANHSWRTVQRAKRKLNVSADKEAGAGSPWFWQLPKGKAASSS